MPPRLKAIVRQLPNEQKVLYQNVANALEAINIDTELSLLRASRDSLVAQTGLPPQLVHSFQQLIIARNMCKETTEVPRPHWFSTGHDNLDALLGGGFRSNYAIEIAGPYASKSKLGHMAVSQFKDADKDGNVAIIDTTGSTTAAFTKVDYYQALSLDHLQRVLEQIGALQATTDNMRPLVVLIEDISSLLSPRHSEKEEVLSLTRSIQSLCRMNATTVLIVHTAAKHAMPAWEACLDVQLWLDTQDEKVECRVTKHRSAAAPTQCHWLKQ